MTKGTQLLKQAQKIIIDFANANGISLQDEFGTPERFRQYVISYTTKTLIDRGMTIEAALDLLCGDGTYQRICDECWATLNAA